MGVSFARFFQRFANWQQRVNCHQVSGRREDPIFAYVVAPAALALVVYALVLVVALMVLGGKHGPNMHVDATGPEGALAL